MKQNNIQTGKDDNTEARVIELVREYMVAGMPDDEVERLKGVPVTRETRLMDDLDFDPLDIVECVMTVEDAFDGIFLTEKQCDALKTVGDLVDAVQVAKAKEQRYY